MQHSNKSNRQLFQCLKLTFKVDSIQEAFAKCFEVLMLFEILETTWKKQNKKHENARFVNEKLKTKILMFLV